MSSTSTKTAMEEAVKNVAKVYADIISGTREPITIHLQKEQNSEKLTALILALNKMVRALDDDEGRDFGNNVTKARMAILEDLARRFKAGDKTVIPCQDTGHWHKPQANYFSGRGEMVCPIDGGKLRYSRAGYNGHVHAACSNEGCVRWME